MEQNPFNIFDHREFVDSLGQLNLSTELYTRWDIFTSADVLNQRRQGHLRADTPANKNMIADTHR